MNNKPALALTRKVKQAKRELKQEDKPLKRIVRTTISIDTDLLCSVKQVAVKRKRAGIQPDTVSGIIREALTKIVQAEVL